MSLGTSKLAVFFGFFFFSVSAQFVQRTNLAGCRSCCNQVLDFAPGLNFDVDVCRNSGCFRVEGATARCIELFNNQQLTDLQRLSCEIGRDMLTSGFTPLIVSNNLFQCKTGGVLEQVDFPVVNQNDFIIGAAPCQSCCRSTNDNLDGGPNQAQFDDFGSSNCQAACVSGATDFNNQFSRDRTAALIALDFRTSGTTQLEEISVTCDANGQISTSAFTFAPTTAIPTSSPVETTPSPTVRPSPAPTRSPLKPGETASPTEAEENEPPENNEADALPVDADTLIYAGAGLLGLCTLLAVMFMLGRLQGGTKQVLILDGEAARTYLEDKSSVSRMKSGKPPSVFEFEMSRKPSTSSNYSNSKTDLTKGTFPTSPPSSAVFDAPEIGDRSGSFGARSNFSPTLQRALLQEQGQGDEPEENPIEF